MTPLRNVISADGFKRLAYWCQGCEDVHVVRVQTDAGTPHPCWTWDGNAETPTFEPSVLVTCNWSEEDGGPTACHTFIRGGMVQFLGDCTHALAGQTLPLPPWPYEDGKYGGVEPLSNAADQG